jgi:hypothetical protein
MDDPVPNVVVSHFDIGNIMKKILKLNVEIKIVPANMMLFLAAQVQVHWSITGAVA